MLPLTYGRPLGWMPGIGEDHHYITPYHCQGANRGSFLPSSRSSSPPNSSEASSISPTSVTSRRHHHPGWIARPRNAFILFRCEYSQIHCKRGRRVRLPPGTSTEPTLSKRAAIAWSQMTREQKEPYLLRAEEERIEHARRYPEYRYRPQRRLGTEQRGYNLRQLATDPKEILPDQCHDAILSKPINPISSRRTDPYPSISKDLCPDPLQLEKQMLSMEWGSALSCNVLSVDSDCGKSVPEIFPEVIDGGSLNDETLPNVSQQELEGKRCGPIDIASQPPVMFHTPMSFYSNSSILSMYGHQASFPPVTISPRAEFLPNDVDSGSSQPPYCPEGTGTWSWTLPPQDQSLSSCSLRDALVPRRRNSDDAP